MKKEKALEKLQKAKVDAVTNSTVIKVGRLELNNYCFTECVERRLRLKRKIQKGDF